MASSTSSLPVEINGEQVQFVMYSEAGYGEQFIVGGSVYNGHLHGFFDWDDRRGTLCLPDVRDGVCYPGLICVAPESSPEPFAFWQTPMAVG